MKKFINAIPNVVAETLKGAATLNPGLSLMKGENVIIRSDLTELLSSRQVSIISGGGSGHEPAHFGYVGPGMLTAAVAGEVFTSPSIDSILQAIRAVSSNTGVLIIIKNYTGDRLNFGLAAEIARSEGIPVETVVVADDVALALSENHAGRRGIAGTVLIHKIAGAAAHEGCSLSQVADEARSAANDLGTMGIALSSCTIPASGVSNSGLSLADNEIEWGLGIHGEPGVERGPMLSADAIVERLLKSIISCLAINQGDHVVLLVNNLGGTPSGELHIIVNSAVMFLNRFEIHPERVWAGAFLTSLETAGISLSLMKVDDQRLKRLDAPAHTSAWPIHLGRIGDSNQTIAFKAPRIHIDTEADISNTHSTIPLKIYKVIEAACRSIIDSERVLTEMDRKIGDGDLGISLSRGASAILASLDRYRLKSNWGSILRYLAGVIRHDMGGTSGALYSTMLLRAGSILEQYDQPTLSDWSRGFQAAVEAIMEIGGAEVGDRTMIDALFPATRSFAAMTAQSNDIQSILNITVEAAKQGAESTSSMRPRRGRASYMGERVLGFVDPGAHAVTIWLTAIRDAIVGDMLSKK